MVPKQYALGEGETLNVVLQVYGKYLREHYELEGESREWLLYKEREGL